jgi:hypothetical protein
MNSLPHQRNHAVVAATAITSIAISLYLYAGRDIINSDGILYLDVSRAFLNEGFTAAMDMFAWPFFSILVGLVHVATGLNLENAALTLNAVFQLFTCLLFVRIYQEVASSDSRPWVAAIVILCFPLLNDYRGMVIRDFGFLVFLLAGLLQFLRYGKSHDWKNAIGWQLFMVLAALFRIEAIAFAAIAPFYFVCRRAQLASNFIDYLRLNSLFLGAILLLALLVAINPELAALELRHTVRLWLDYASLANFLRCENYYFSWPAGTGNQRAVLGVGAATGGATLLWAVPQASHTGTGQRDHFPVCVYWPIDSCCVCRPTILPVRPLYHGNRDLPVAYRHPVS